MTSPPGSLMMSFARPDPAATFITGWLDVWADRATPPNGTAASASTNARRPRPTLAMPTSGEGSALGKPVRNSNEAEPLDLLEQAKVSIHARAQHIGTESSRGIRESSNRPQNGGLSVTAEIGWLFGTISATGS